MEDLDGIAVVLDEVWGEKLLYAVGQRYIEDARRALWVGVDADGIVGGFVAAFAADMASGCTWVVDMLAVRPSFQRCGFGRALVRAALVAASALDIAQSRALVRVGNIASERCFADAGYDCDLIARHMMLWSPQETAAEGATELHILSVDALVYRGLWIDGLERAEHVEQRRAIASARALAAREGRDSVSALVVADRFDALASDLRASAQVQGDFRWWQCAVGAAAE